MADPRRDPVEAVMTTTHGIADIYGVELSAEDDEVLRRAFGRREDVLRSDIDAEQQDRLVESLTILVRETSHAGSVENALAGLCPGFWPIC